jgi:glycogen debranching enzyme
VIAGLDAVLAPEGWPYASSEPVSEEDLGRFHALFGRDALITALALLPARPEVARATLRELARLQADHDDPATDAEPGRIVHEYRPDPPARFAEQGWALTDGELRYYGSADGTSWFLVLLASLEDAALEDELEPAWRAAGAWLLRALERGNGLVWTPARRHPGGLRLQGWRDAVDPPSGKGAGIVEAGGEFPPAPVADADSQAAAVAGLRALHALSGEGEHPALAERVRARFEPETLALAGPDARPVPGAGSQLGWLLWAGLDDAAYAERLCAADVLTPFGLRTLSSEHPAFYPAGYHRGAVWPFDSWLGWGGLRAAGRAGEAERVRSGVLEAIARLGHAPECYAVAGSQLERIPYANWLQAWTVGARWALEHGWDGRSERVFR